jgi:hypothetical protein
MNKFRSGFEKRIWDNARKRRKKIDYEPQNPRIHYTIPYRYIPDFVLPNGVVVEAKGYLRPRDRTKMRKVREQNPSIDIRLLFQNANCRLTKSKNSETYWQWAERLGFKWAEGDQIPEEWFDE